MSQEDSLKEVSDEVDKLISGADKKKNKTGEEEQTVDVSSLSDAQLMHYLSGQTQIKEIERLQRRMLKGQEVEKEYKFWKTQPVPALNEKIDDGCNGPINPIMTVDQIRQEPYNMPAGFEWCTLDVFDPNQILELYTLLNENYVEDDDCTFRFDYSVAFLQWALTPPGFLREWHVGVRNSKTGALMGCITAVPVELQVYDKEVPMVEINFLCVHKKLRTKRLAPVLIKEITRRVNVTDRWQAVYTAGVVLPKPVGKCRYYHRPLNPKKLIEARFSSLPPKTTMQNHIKSLRLPNKPISAGLRAMTYADVAAVHTLLNDYLRDNTHMHQVFTVEDVAHIFLPRTGVVNSYVVETDGKVTDFCSFYHLPSSIINNQLHSKLNAVYSYYNIAHTMPIEELMRDLLIMARNEGADVFNALDVMENGKTFPGLQFGIGDGYLQYYLYNWKCPTMTADKVGLVLL